MEGPLVRQARRILLTRCDRCHHAFNECDLECNDEGDLLCPDCYEEWEDEAWCEDCDRPLAECECDSYDMAFDDESDGIWD